MFSNLLASSMDKNVKSKAPPSFVEIIKQLSGEEAAIIKELAAREIYPYIIKNISVDSHTMQYEVIKNCFIDLCKEFTIITSDSALGFLDNLARLRIVEFVNFVEAEYIEEEKLYYEGEIEIGRIRNEGLLFSSYGKQFVFICVKYPDL